MLYYLFIMLDTMSNGGIALLAVYIY